MAYPRLRGEHHYDSRGLLMDSGLPPLARGTHDLLQRNSDAAGPTPACAGNTRPGSSNETRRRAYPRLRGEHVVRGECAACP